MRQMHESGTLKFYVDLHAHSNKRARELWMDFGWIQTQNHLPGDVQGKSPAGSEEARRRMQSGNGLPEIIRFSDSSES